MRDWNNRTTIQIGLPWCLLGLILTIPACRSVGGLLPGQSPKSVTVADLAADTSLAPSKSVTFVDHPELQSGTGAIDPGGVPEFSTTGSGLKYRVLRESSGKKPTSTSTVTVNYRGWLGNGRVFDSSYERGEPTSFPLYKVVDGWTEGMQLVGEGGMIELWVPSKLGYGEQGSPGSIPPHSNLHFVIELLSVD